MTLSAFASSYIGSRGTNQKRSSSQCAQCVSRSHKRCDDAVKMGHETPKYMGRSGAAARDTQEMTDLHVGLSQACHHTLLERNFPVRNTSKGVSSKVLFFFNKVAFNRRLLFEEGRATNLSREFSSTGIASEFGTVWYSEEASSVHRNSNKFVMKKSPFQYSVRFWGHWTS